MNFRIEPLGDSALLLCLDPQDTEAANRRVHALRAALEARRPPWLQDLVPAYASLALVLDTDAMKSPDPLAMARGWLESLVGNDQDMGAVPPGRCIDIPVCYGGELGPDLDAWSHHAGFSPEEGIARHAAGDYRVAMLGFAPGFPYLMGLDPALAMPRLDTPRARIPAGSVGIGGGQTGVYPAAGPGGWRLLGRTPLRLFDPGADPPTLLAPGDRVRFVAIDRARYEALGGAPE